ncbi:t-snare domain-containing protein [Anaeramoeba flamelloides]|uniref:T-snare domain-containing protein n=1 Tax=Anaeramoeba flamelloides TaxID=1746091 RepID=A0AAV7ZS19_9EUKA|nr:t-snare domain-containing protein [Anaeramoeba flamelloides]
MKSDFSDFAQSVKGTLASSTVLLLITTILTTAKSYLTKTFQLSRDKPKTLAFTFISVAYYLAGTTFSLAERYHGGKDLDVFMRSCFVFAAITMGFGPFLVLSPTEKIILKKETFFKKLTRGAQTKDARTGFLMIFIVITLMQGCVVFSFWYSLNDVLHLDIKITIGVVVGYSLVCLFYLVIFYSVMMKKEVVIGGINLMEQLRKKIFIRTRKGHKIEILGTKLYKYFYVIFFVIVLLLILSGIIFMFIREVEDFKSLTGLSKAIVIVFYSLNILGVITYSGFILNVAFHPIETTEVEISKGVTVEVNRVKYVAIARSSDRTLLAKFVAPDDPDQWCIDYVVKREIKNSSIDPGLIKIFRCSKYALFQQNDQMSMFFIGTGPNYNSKIGIYFLQKISQKVESKYYNQSNNDFQYNGLSFNSLSVPLNNYLEKTSRKFSTIKDWPKLYKKALQFELKNKFSKKFQIDLQKNIKKLFLINLKKVNKNHNKMLYISKQFHTKVNEFSLMKKKSEMQSKKKNEQEREREKERKKEREKGKGKERNKETEQGKKRISNVINRINETKMTLDKNIEKVINRGSTLDLLEERSDALISDSLNFYKSAKKVSNFSFGSINLNLKRNSKRKHSKRLISESRQQQQIIKQREEEIIEIENNVRDVNEMFKDIATIIDAQSSSIDAINYNIESANSRVSEGHETLRMAHMFRKRKSIFSRKKKKKISRLQIEKEKERKITSHSIQENLFFDDEFQDESYIVDIKRPISKTKDILLFDDEEDEDEDELKDDEITLEKDLGLKEKNKIKDINLWDKKISLGSHSGSGSGSESSSSSSSDETEFEILFKKSKEKRTDIYQTNLLIVNGIKKLTNTFQKLSKIPNSSTSGLEIIKKEDLNYKKYSRTTENQYFDDIPVQDLYWNDENNILPKFKQDELNPILEKKIENKFWIKKLKGIKRIEEYYQFFQKKNKKNIIKFPIMEFLEKKNTDNHYNDDENNKSDDDDDDDDKQLNINKNNENENENENDQVNNYLEIRKQMLNELFDSIVKYKNRRTLFSSILLDQQYLNNLNKNILNSPIIKKQPLFSLNIKQYKKVNVIKISKNILQMQSNSLKSNEHITIFGKEMLKKQEKIKWDIQISKGLPKGAVIIGISPKPKEYASNMNKFQKNKIEKKYSQNINNSIQIGDLPCSCGLTGSGYLINYNNNYKDDVGGKIKQFPDKIKMTDCLKNDDIISILYNPILGYVAFAINGWYIGKGSFDINKNTPCYPAITFLTSTISIKMNIDNNNNGNEFNFNNNFYENESHNHFLVIKPFARFNSKPYCKRSDKLLEKFLTCIENTTVKKIDNQYRPNNIFKIRVIEILTRCNVWILPFIKKILFGIEPLSIEEQILLKDILLIARKRINILYKLYKVEYANRDNTKEVMKKKDMNNFKNNAIWVSLITEGWILSPDYKIARLFLIQNFKNSKHKYNDFQIFKTVLFKFFSITDNSKNRRNPYINSAVKLDYFNYDIRSEKLWSRI